MQMLAYNFRYIFIFEKHRQKFGVPIARATPLLQTLLITSRIGGLNLVFTFADFSVIIFFDFFAMLYDRHRPVMEQSPHGHGTPLRAPFTFLLALLLTFDFPLYFPDECRAGGPVKESKATVTGILFRTVRRAVVNVFELIAGPPVRYAPYRTNYFPS